MGLRGPGARPIKRSEKPAKVRRKPAKAKGSRADRVIAFLQNLKITSGRLAGKNLRLEPWQVEIVRDIYATDAAGQRIVRTAVLSLPRKVGKTTLAAGLALCHLAGPEAVPRGEILSGASDRGQASKLYKEIKAFALADGALADDLIFRDFAKTIEHVPTGSIFEALSSDAAKAHGKSVHCGRVGAMAKQRSARCARNWARRA
jgi:phage terminase large subunit-like protein